MRLQKFVAVTALAACFAPTFVSADAADDAIDARRGYYQVVKHNAGMLFGMAKGNIAYDAAQAQTFADNLKALADMNTGSMWPQGSDNASKPGKTRALPVAWETYPAILEKQEAFKAASANMAANVGGGLDALLGNIGALGASCKGCHDNYRAKEF